MNNEAEKRIAAKLAKTMAMLCVRNTHIETLHAGKTSEKKTGDVTVVDAYEKHIAVTDFSRISDKEMRDLIRDIVNRLYTFHLRTDEPGLKAEIEKRMAVSGRWDEPEIDTMMLKKGGAV
jgi:hypothetical protein